MMVTCSLYLNLGNSILESEIAAYLLSLPVIDRVLRIFLYSIPKGIFVAMAIT